MDTHMLEMRLVSELDLIPRDTACQRVLEVTVKAPPAARYSTRPRLNLALVLDRSGSMHGEKLEFVKRAAQHVLDLLAPLDRVAVVTYDHEIDLLAPSAEIQEEIRADYRQRIARLQSGGMTNLSGGWLQGCQEVARFIAHGQINRALLLTDGLANVGITDEEILNEHARNLSLLGVSTSTFGVGEGFNEHLLEGISNQGGGNFYYIGSPREIPAIFEREFTELAEVTAQGAQMEIELPQGVDVQVPGDWRCTRADRRLSIYLGDLNGGRQVTIYLKLSLPPFATAEQLDVNIRIHALDRESQPLDSQARSTFHYAGSEQLAAAQPDREMMARFVKVEMADVASTALKLERQGEGEKASQMVQASIAMSAPYMAKAEEGQYSSLAERMLTGMDEADRKTTHYQSYNQKRGRNQ